MEAAPAASSTEADAMLGDAGGSAGAGGREVAGGGGPWALRAAVLLGAAALAASVVAAVCAAATLAMVRQIGSDAGSDGTPPGRQWPRVEVVAEECTDWASVLVASVGGVESLEVCRQRCVGTPACAVVRYMPLDQGCRVGPQDARLAPGACEMYEADCAQASGSTCMEFLNVTDTPLIPWSMEIGYARTQCENAQELQIGRTVAVATRSACGARCWNASDCTGFSFGGAGAEASSYGDCILLRRGCRAVSSPSWDYHVMIYADALDAGEEFLEHMGAEAQTWFDEYAEREANAAIAPGKVSGANVPSGPPENITRDLTVYDWCGVGQGLASVTFWPGDEQSAAVTVQTASVRWVQWPSAAEVVSWQCDGANKVMSTSLPGGLAPLQWLSLQVWQENRSWDLVSAGGLAGRLKWNTWNHTDYISSIPFTTGTENYTCFKIPAYLRTSAGTVLAFSEARGGTCGDFDATDLVVKRSTDGGRTWGALQKLVEPDPGDAGVCGHALVIGNVAPVQLNASAKQHAGRILAPHTRNNFKMWIVYSDDDGVTWSETSEILNGTLTDAEPDCSRGMSYLGLPGLDSLSLNTLAGITKWLVELCAGSASALLDPYNNPQFSETLNGSWQFVGTGPPGSIELQSGRVLVPSYHSYIRGLEGGIATISQLYNNFALGHMVASDDGGDTWQLAWTGRTERHGRTGQGANENSLVQFSDGSILMNSRALATGSPQYRLQAHSDDDGESFTASEFVKDLPQPFNGCQGSTVGGTDDVVYTAEPDPAKADSLAQKLVDHLPKCGSLELTGRTRVSVWRSDDRGQTYKVKQRIDDGLSAQTALQFQGGQLTLLYEQADPPPVTPKEVILNKAVQNLQVLIPDRFVFREVTGITDY